MDVEYLSYLQIKNRTLKKIIEAVNERFNFDEVLSLKFDFNEADCKLEYFNSKAFIKSIE